MDATTDARSERRRTGVVLAGGRSRRFGPTDKALAPLDGRPMLRRVVDRLGGVVDGVVVNCRPDQRDRFAAALDGVSEVRFAVDPPGRTDGGPVAGLRTALDAVGTPTAAVAACDTPRIPPSLLRALFERAAGRAGAVPSDGERRYPLCAVYRTSDARAACDAVGRNGSMRAVVNRLDPVVVPPATVRKHLPPRSSEHCALGALASVDTREELSALECAVAPVD